MEMRDIASYFDRADFDVFDPVTQEWQLAVFSGQLKDSDYFVPLWHRSTRRRVLTTAPDQEPPGLVIRPTGLGNEEVYLVGSASRDVNFQAHYRTLFPLHRAAGFAEIVRYAPAGPPEDPGWDVPQTIFSTFVDVELRTQQNDPEAKLEVHGNYYIFLPAGTPVEDQDYVVLGGKKYYVEEPYEEAGFLACRATDAPDTRHNVVYRRLVGESYVNGRVVKSYQDYNVTVYPSEASYQDGNDKNDLVVYPVKFLIRSQNIGFKPAINDLVVYDERDFVIRKVGYDSLNREWHLEAQA